MNVVISLFVAWLILGVIQYFRYYGWLKKANPKLLGVIPYGQQLFVDEYIKDTSVCVIDVLMADQRHYIFLAPVAFVEFMPSIKKMLGRIMARRYGGALTRKIVDVRWVFNKGVEM